MAQADHLLEQAYDDSVLLANSERRSRRLPLSHSGPLTNGLGLSSRHHALKSQSCRFTARQADIVRALEAREQNRSFGRNADLVKALEARQRNRLSSQSGSATSSGASPREKSNGAGSVPIVTLSQPQQQQEQEEAQVQVQEKTAAAQVQAPDKPVAAQAQAPAPAQAVAEPPKEPRKSNLKSSSIKQPAAAAAASDAAPRGRVLILTAPELDVDHHPTGSRHHVDGDHHARVSPAQPLDARVSPAQPLDARVSPAQPLDAKDEKEGGEADSASPGPGVELPRLSDTAVDHCLASPLDLEHSELLGADLQARFQLLKADHHSSSPSPSHTGPPPASPTLTHQVQALRSGSTGPLVIRLTSSGSLSASQLSARTTSLQQSSGKAPPSTPAPPPPPSAPAVAATTPSPLPQAPAVSPSSPPSDDASSANTCCSCLPSCLKQKDRKPSSADPLPKSSHPSPSHPSPPSPFHKQLQTPIATSNKHVAVPAKEEEPHRHEVDSAAASPQTQDFLQSVMDEVQQEEEGEDEEQEQDWQDDIATMKDSIHGPNILKTFSLKDVNKELSKATLDEATLAREAERLVQQALDLDLADGKEMGIDSAGELHNVKRRHMRSKSFHVKGMGNASNASGNASNANGNGHASGSGFSESEDQDTLDDDQEDDSDGTKQRRKKAKRRAKR